MPLTYKNICRFPSLGFRNFRSLLFYAFITAFPLFSQAQQLSIPLIGTPVIENFDGMGRSANAFFPTGFRIDTAGRWDGTASSNLTTKAAGTTGSGALSSFSSGGCYNFCNGDTAISTDRALGFLNTGSYGGPRSIVLWIKNTTTQNIGSLSIAFDYEKYRSGGREFNWYFYHGSTSQPGIPESSGNQNFPDDGRYDLVYNPPLTFSKTVVIGNLNITPGSTYYLRWHLVGSSNAVSSCSSSGCSKGQGLGIDNLSITAYPGCTPPSVQAAIISLDTITTRGSVLVSFTRGNGTGGSVIIASTSPTLTANPSSGNSYAADTVFGSGASLGGGFVVYSGAAGGAGSTGNQINITGLANNTRYYFFIFDFDSPNNCYNLSTSFFAGTTLPPPLTSTYHYRSVASGSWSNKNNWQVSADNSTNWVAADLPPDSTAKNITIRAGDSIDINSNLIADQIFVYGLLSQSAGVFRLANGISSADLNIAANGILKIQTGPGPSNAYGVSFILLSGASIYVNSNARIIIGNGGAVGAGFENLALLGSSVVSWFHNSVFEWNTSTPFETERVNYFPGSSATTIPVFRVNNVNNDFFLGTDSTSAWNGIFEANANITFLNAGTKTFRNGITGSGNVTQAAGCGAFRITGNTAYLGGAGSLILNGASGDSIGVVGSPLVKCQMTSSKNIIGGPTVVLDTLDAQGFQITGNATTQLTLLALTTPSAKSGVIRTSNAGGFYGNSLSTISASIDSSKVNVRRGRVDHTSASSQTIMPYAYGDLFNSGNGPRVYSPAGEIRIAKVFSPGTGAATVTGSLIHFNDTASQLITSFRYNCLSISSGGKAITKSSSGNIGILDSLKIFSNTTFALAGSDTVFLYSSDAGTARLAKLDGSLTYSTNNSRFVVERYIGASRKWHLLSVPTFNSSVALNQTIKQAWMEGNNPGGNSRPGYGTFITSNDPQWSGKGFDTLSPAGPSMKYFDPVNNLYVGVDSPASYKMTAATSSGAVARTAYFLFVRGDRSATPSNTVSNATILRTVGRLATASSIGVSPIPAGKFFAIGNPYASPVLFSRLSISTNMSNAFYVWDPKLASGYGLGAFQTFMSQGGGLYTPIPGGGSYTDPLSFGLIQSGQAFFVYNPDSVSSGSISFNENSKVGSTNNVFRPGSNSFNRLKANIFRYNAAGEGDLLDGCQVNFSPLGNNSIDINDFRKLSNPAANFAAETERIKLAVEDRKEPVLKDTLFFSMSGFRTGSYFLELNATEWKLNPRLSAFLYDRYTGMQTAIDTGTITRVDFSIDANSLSFASNRFLIFFGMVKPRDNLQAGNTEVPVVSKSTFDVFPNPVGIDRKINILLPSADQEYYVDLIDALGINVFSKVILSGKARPSWVLPQSLPSGVYYLRLSCQGCPQPYSSRVIIP